MRENIKEIFGNKWSIAAIIVAIFSAYLLFPANFTMVIWPLPADSHGQFWNSIDPSWMMGLNYIKHRGVEWGSGLAFTYGPLATFFTRIGWGENKWSLLAFDIFMFINFFAVFFVGLKQTAHKIIGILALIIVIVMFPASALSGMAIVCMGFLIFWIRLSMDNPRPLYFTFQIALVTMLFFIKFNTGLIVVPLYFAGIIYCVFSKKIRPVIFAVLALLPVVLIVIFSKLLHVALVSYIFSGLQVIKGFNDIMYLISTVNNCIIFLVVTWLLLTIVLIFNLLQQSKKDYLKALVILFMMEVSIYVLYKQAFVRGDLGHMKDFFIFIPIIAFCNIDLYRKIGNIAIKICFLAALLVPVYFLMVQENLGLDIQFKLSKAQYFSEFQNFDSDHVEFLTNAVQMPQNIKDKIGNGKVDVYPWNIQTLLENKLNYQHRPIIQSYAAYTPYLENLNFEHYNGPNAPEFVVFDLISIDYRLSFFDEPKLNLALLKNYEVVDEFDSFGRKQLLLQNKKDFRPIELRQIDEYAMDINSPLVPKRDIYYEIEVYQTLTGKIKSLYDHAPEIELEISLKSDKNRKHRTSKLLLETGVFCENYMEGVDDFKNQILNLPGKEIKFFRLRIAQPSMFQNKIRVKEYAISQP